jgi:diguanylate cyclase (GGDEF)-like protein
MSSRVVEGATGSSSPVRDDRILPIPGLDPGRAPTSGLNPSLASAFAALSALEQTEREGPPARPNGSPEAGAADVGYRAALSRAAARLDDSLAVLADARRALAGGRPADAIAAVEAECRRLAVDLSHYRPSLVADADAPAGEVAARREFDRVVERLVGTARPSDRPSSLMLVGIDRLSRLDAVHGEGASSDVLAAVGRAMATSLAGVGEVFRFDLDVFAAVLPSLPLRQAVAVAEHLRRSVTGRRLVRRSTGSDLGRITLSAGVVCASGGPERSAAVDRAVRCLGEAQWSGGNRVVCETDPAFEQALRAIA